MVRFLISAAFWGAAIIKRGRLVVGGAYFDLIAKLCDAYTAQKMKFSIKDFFSKCDQIHSFLQIWSHLLKKSLMENYIFLCSVRVPQ